jgi:hypothetical protein
MHKSRARFYATQTFQLVLYWCASCAPHTFQIGWKVENSRLRNRRVFVLKRLRIQIRQHKSVRRSLMNGMHFRLRYYNPAQTITGTRPMKGAGKNALFSFYSIADFIVNLPKASLIFGISYYRTGTCTALERMFRGKRFRSQSKFGKLIAVLAPCDFLKVRICELAWWETVEPADWGGADAMRRRGATSRWTGTSLHPYALLF